MDSSKDERWIIPFMKFSRLRLYYFSGMEVDGDYEGEALLIIYNKIHSLAK